MIIINQDQDIAYTMDAETEIYFRPKWGRHYKTGEEKFRGYNVYGKKLIRRNKRLKSEILLGTYDDENEAACVVREIERFFKSGKFKKYSLPEGADIEELFEEVRG